VYRLPIPVAHGKRYRWRVKLDLGEGQSAAMGWTQLAVDLLPPSLAALEPKADGEAYSQPKFRWRYEDLTAQSAFRIDLAKSSKGRAARPVGQGAGESAFMLGSRLRTRKRYFWRVIVRDAAGNESRSEWRGFKTKKAGKSTTKKESSKRGREARVTAASLNLRAGPGTSHQVLGQLKRGQVVIQGAEQSGWVEVEAEVGGKRLRGFVSKRFLKE